MTSVDCANNDVVSVSNQRRLRERRTNGRRNGPSRSNEDSGGGRGDEMGGGGLSNMLTLVFHILSLSELQLPGQQRLDLNERDEAFITRFFEMNGFRFRNRNNNGFYFDVGNRSVDEIVLALDCLKDRLKSICFSRFCGEIVNGREISQPEDIVLSFGIHATYGDIPGIPSTNMFI